MRSILRDLRDAIVEVALAGAVGGVLEGARLAGSAGSIGATVIVIAVATLGAAGLALIVRAGLAAVSRLALVRAWTADLGAGGERRVVAAWRALLASIVVGLAGLVGFEWLAWTHERFRFNDGGPFALASISVIAVVAVALVVGALALDRRLRTRLPPAALDSRRATTIALAVTLVLVLVVPALMVHHALPALELDYAILPSVVLAALIVAIAARAATRLAVRIAAIAAVLAALGGTAALRSSAGARSAIVERGIASRVVASTLWRAGDRDRDGYAGASVGGADCDDANAARSPGARDVPGNGIDENCSGADAVRTTFGLRNLTRPVPPVQTKPSIVLISIDALRADHLGTYGYRRHTSPALDALAAGGVTFDAAYTPCPSTRCALPALHTGRYASTLTAIDQGTIPTLARVLRDAGWQTAAITCCDRFAVARREVVGFQTIDASADTIRRTRAGQSNADVVVDRTLAWLRGRDPARPYFAWLHLYEPHYPYSPPGGSAFGDDSVARYDGEIAFADAQLARLFAELDPQTIVVVTADHGEEFGEHGLRFHARSLYNAVVRVPLLMRVPGAAARRVTTPVSIVDVMPTLLDLAGVLGPAGMNGRTLVPALHGRAAPARPILIELAHDHQITRDMAGVVSPPWKVIWDRQANAWSLFKLDDTGDATNLRDDAALPELQRLLRDTLDRETGVIPDAAP
jgi:hypothetical protein